MSSNKHLRKVISITVRGETEEDLEFAIEEAVSKINDGFTSGRDTNDTGEFFFSVSDGLETEEERKLDGFNKACLFYQELTDSVETLTGIVEEHGARTLADLLYLQLAILKNGFIDHYPDESKALDIASALPSGDLWKEYIKVEYLMSSVG